MHIGLPQGILLGMILFGAGVGCAKFGERKSDSYDIFDVLVIPGLMITLLWWGGFFK